MDVKLDILVKNNNIVLYQYICDFPFTLINNISSFCY